MTCWAEAQQTLIGTLLLEPERYAGDIFQRARPEHFGDAALRHLFEAALGLWDADRPIDPVTLLHAAGFQSVRCFGNSRMENPRENEQRWHIAAVKPGE